MAAESSDALSLREAGLFSLTLGGGLLLVMILLSWPLTLELGSSYLPSAFGASHAWVADLVWRADDWSEIHLTDRAGWPEEHQARYIGWLLSLAALPLRWLGLGALATGQWLHLLSLPLSGVVAGLVLRRLTGAAWLDCALGAALFVFSPFALATWVTGELPKLQLGFLPLALWLLHHILSSSELRTQAISALVFALVCLACGLTSPYFALSLPLMALVYGALALRRRAHSALLLSAGGLLLGLLPVWWYYRSGDPLRPDLFAPALAGPRPELLPRPHPVASVYDLLIGARHEPVSQWETRHLSYLGLPLGLTLCWSSWRARRSPAPGRRLGWVLLSLFTLLAMGPELVWDERWTGIPLPAALLEQLGYPYSEGGLYYRLIAWSSLGAGLILAANLRSGQRWLRWAVPLILLESGVRAGPFPLELEPLPASAELSTWRDEAPGAVLYLPAQRGPSLVAGQRGLLLALAHGQATNVLPRDVPPGESQRLEASWRSLLGQTGAREALLRSGIRGVLLDTEQPGAERWTPRLRRLGAPHACAPGLRVWDLRQPPRQVPASWDRASRPLCPETSP